MIRIGVSGSGGLSYEEAFSFLSKNGVGALEIPFTYGVRMTSETAVEVGVLAKRYGISLSIHAPYYINLASLDKEKVLASRKRILDSCERGHQMSAGCIVFHAGFYQKRDPLVVYDIIKDEIIELLRILNENEVKVSLCPETTGKASQFGSFDELMRLSDETGCGMCVDFSHLIARSVGKINLSDVFVRLKGKKVHGHLSGIEYSEKGEKRHILTPISLMKEVLGLAREFKVDLTIISESPDPFGDAVKMVRL